MTTPQIMVKGRTVLSMEAITHDGNLAISVGASRKTKTWRTEQITWSALIARLSETKRTEESQATYFAMSKSEQDNIKDVGGFVGGLLRDGQRRADTVISRQVIALDLDNASTFFWQEFSMLFSCTALVYSTHKYTDAQPRLRLVIPLSRPVDADEYVAICRKIAENFGLEHFDPTTFQASRLMYWPSTSYDATYFCASQDGEFLDADLMLNQYKNWKDRAEWAYSLHEMQQPKKAVEKAKKVEDPLKKRGWIAAFCKAHLIPDAIDLYLSDVYEPVEGKDDRYTYIGGSSTGGAVVYEDKWLYSNHATDPVSQRLCNAFDLVRLHLYGELDSKTTITDPVKLPSYKKMLELCQNDDAVKAMYADVEYRKKMAKKGQEIPDEVDTTWTQELDVNPKTGAYIASLPNQQCIMENDQNLKDILAWDAFTERYRVTRQPIWRSKLRTSKNWEDMDDSQLRYYIAKYYGIDNPGQLNAAVKNVAENHAYHEVRQYLQGLTWDGVPRLDRLFIDYLGAPDTEYVRRITHKMMLAAVFRVFEPGCKWDTMVVLFGEQGEGKSRTLRLLGKNWFNESLTSFEGKDAMELLRGSWIVEIGELAAISKSETEVVKQFTSKQYDTYREAYGHHVKEFARQCIFVGTTNKKHFLTDATGNRRFFPIDVAKCNATKSPYDPNVSQEIDQMWAEAYQYYCDGEDITLGEELEEMGRIEQEKHEEHRSLAGIILEFLNTDVPENWYSFSQSERTTFLNGDKDEFGNKIPLGDHPFKRTRICLAEIFVECLGGSLDRFERRKLLELEDAMRKLKKYWKEVDTYDFGKPYGRQIQYVRIGSPEDPNYKQGSLFDSAGSPITVEPVSTQNSSVQTATQAKVQETTRNNSSKPAQDVKKTTAVSEPSQKVDAKPVQNTVAKPSINEEQSAKATAPTVEQKQAPVSPPKNESAPSQNASPTPKKEPPSTPTQAKTPAPASSQIASSSPKRRGRPPKKSRKDMTQKERWLDILNSTDGAEDEKGVPKDDG